MMKNRSFTIFSQNNKGVALLMVMSSIAILTFLLAVFTFDTKLNKIKIYNQQNKIQAKLNAEAGMRFAMAKLKLYRNGRNLIEKDKNLKELVDPSILESVVIQPFMLPLPIGGNIDPLIKSALAEFEKNNIIKGQLFVSMTAVSGFLNPNHMRLVIKPSNDEDNDSFDKDDNLNEDQDEDKIPPHLYTEKQLITAMTEIFETKKEEDPQFDSLYGNLEPSMLIKELKYFVNNKEDFNDPEKAEIEMLYSGKDTSPKHAPLSSISELYLLEGWDDTIVGLIKDRLTVHETTFIPINEINANQVKTIFPAITKDQLKEFFKYRDGPSGEDKAESNSEDEDDENRPHPFKSVDGFKNYVVNELNVIEEPDFDKLVKEYKQAGLQFGIAGKLYKVTSKGMYENSSYTISAFIDLPVKPLPVKKKKTEEEDEDEDPDEYDEDEDSKVKTQEEIDKKKKEEEEKKKKAEKKELPMELLAPRIIEIFIGE